MMACRPALVWGGILAAGIAAEVHALISGHHDCTLSAMTREVCRTEHPVGRASFMVGSAALAVWFQYHIVTWKREFHEGSQEPAIARVDRSSARRRTDRRLARTVARQRVKPSA